MPIYEYQCSNCGHELDELQTMSEPPLVKCPKCGKDTLKRLIGTGAGLIFKGSGFYLTDYKKSSKDSENKPSSKSKSTKPSEAKAGETKPSENKSKDSKSIKTESKKS